jgi:hypothetical protein
MTKILIKIAVLSIILAIKICYDDKKIVMKSFLINMVY